MWPHVGLERLKSCAKAQPRCRPLLMKTEIVFFHQPQPDHCFALSQQSLAYALPNQTKQTFACISQSCQTHRAGRRFRTNLMSRYICFSQNGRFDVRFEELVSKAKNPGGFLRKNVFRVHFQVFFL